MWSTSQTNGDGNSVADLFVAGAGWSLVGGGSHQAPPSAAGGATSNDSEPSPATTASPASQGRAAVGLAAAGSAAAGVAAPQTAAVASTSVSVAGTSAASGKVKRRKWTREERAEHSTIEKRRREDFNTSLLVRVGSSRKAIMQAEDSHTQQDLARKLPSISHIKRVNKRVIVKAALDHVDSERRLVLEVLPDVRALVQERDDVLKELNEYRRASGKLERPTAIDPKASIDNLSRVEEYAFNAFAGGFGGNEDDDMDAEQTNAVEQAAPKSLPPRISAPARTNSSPAVSTSDAAAASSSLPPNFLSSFSPQAKSTNLLFDDSALSTSTSGGSATSNIFAAFPQNSPTPADVAQLLSDSTIQDMAVRHLLNSPAFQEALRGSMNRYQPAQNTPYSFGQAANSFNFAQPGLQQQFPGVTGLTPPQQAYQQGQGQQQPQISHDGPFQNPLSPMSAFLYSYVSDSYSRWLRSDSAP